MATDSAANGPSRARPASITYDVKELLSEIRDELKSINVAIHSKADKADVDKLEGRVEAVDRECQNRAQVISAKVQSIDERLDDLPSRVRAIENEKAPTETVQTLQQEMTAMRVFVAKAAGAVIALVAGVEFALRFWVK